MLIEIAISEDQETLLEFTSFLCNSFTGEQVSTIFRDGSIYLASFYPKALNWLEVEIDSISIMEEEEYEYEEELFDDEGDEDFLPAPSFKNSNTASITYIPKNIEGVHFFTNKEDIIHLLLDEGFIPETHFKDNRKKISIDKEARKFLEKHFIIDEIQHLLSNMRTRK